MRPGTSFVSKLTVKKRSRQRIAIRRAEFFVNKPKVRVDGRKPFTLRLSILKSSQRGRAYRLRARAEVAVGGRKTARRSVTVRFVVCSR